MTMELTTLLALSLVAFVAGFVDSIAGGGGLLALPSLMVAGLDPVAALATNKLQGTFGTASATYAFWKKGKLDPRAHLPTVALIFAGAALGVLAVNLAPTQLLKAVMPVLLIAVAIYFALSPSLAEAATAPKMPALIFTAAIAPALGFYDGIFGPGTGSFFMLAQVALLGLGAIEATARTKLFNFTSNIASLIVFAFGGKIIWTIGLAMGLAQFIGAQLGAHVVINNGAKVIRPLLVIVCLGMAAKLLLSADNPLRALFP